MNPRQACLSRVMGVVAALGTAAILWAWWDSTENYIRFAFREGVIISGASSVVISLSDSDVYPGIERSRMVHCGTHLAELFPFIGFSPGYLSLPMWFFLCVFLSALLLLWLVLMKRLARPRITEGSSHGAGG